MWTVLFLALIALAAAQQPQPCNGPASFSGRFRRMDRERKFFVEGRIYYDGENRRIREFEFEEIGREREVYDRLKLYQLNLEYSVNLKARNCTVREPRPSTWFPIGVPPDARFVGAGTIGAVGVPNEEVTLSFFEGEFEGRDPYFVGVTQPDCFVTQFGVFSNTSGFAMSEYYDVTSGITDPEAFIPPRECIQ